MLRARFAAKPAGVRLAHGRLVVVGAGKDVSWLDLNGDDEPLSVEVGGEVYEVVDFYCVEPGCTCAHVSLSFSRPAPDGGEDFVTIGEVLVNPDQFSAALLTAHGPRRLELQRAWEKLKAEQPVEAMLIDRRDEVRRIAPELHDRFGKAVAEKKPAAVAGRNDSCPCGSGLKHKKCCLGK